MVIDFESLEFDIVSVTDLSLLMLGLHLGSGQCIQRGQIEGCIGVCWISSFSDTIYVCVGDVDCGRIAICEEFRYILGFLLFFSWLCKTLAPLQS